MRTSRCIFYTILVTGLCLAYVFLQTEIVKFGYRITSAQKALEVCLDRKKALEFTLSALESPLNLDKNLLKNQPYEMAKGYRLVKLTPRRPVRPDHRWVAGMPAGREPVLKRFAWQNIFGSRSAEARTIKE